MAELVNVLEKRLFRKRDHKMLFGKALNPCAEMAHALIFLPTFETSDMVAKAKRKIKSKTAISMLTWAHGDSRTNVA
jgi:transposase